MTFYTPKPGPELVTTCGVIADPSTHSRGTPPGVGSGHLEQEKTLGHLKEWCYWAGHFRDVHNWCKSSISCTTRKTPAPR